MPHTDCKVSISVYDGIVYGMTFMDVLKIVIEKNVN